ncbi:CHASE4 domain-containing protein [Oceanospirillum beijerinckii]|uniref:sensor histidine kinase n=1 Tax=Oceanospirillum beijerinckii TaxID=64976 RepID=UPI0004260E87|nr:CHASE4 domain-containing protein [Oceanospirillum beijerinckii]
MRTNTSQRFLKMAYPVVVIMMISIGLLAWSLYHSRIKQTEIVAQLSERAMASSLLEADKALNLIALDYAYWDETIKFYHNPDPDWAKKQIGLYLNETFNLSATLLLNQNNKVVWQYQHDLGLPLAAVEKTLLDSGLMSQLSQHWESVPPKVLSSYMILGQEVYSFHAALLTSDEEGAQAKPHDRVALILLRRIDQAYLDTLAEKRQLEGLRLEQVTSLSGHDHRAPMAQTVIEGHLPLRDLQGNMVALLSWYPEYRLADVYREMRPWLLAFIIISGSCFLWYVRRVRQVARILDNEILRRQQAEVELEQHQRHLEQLVEERTDALYEALQKAQAANEAKSRFTAGMSHEMRTPLNAIIGFAQILELDLEDKGQLESLQEILKAGTHLRGMVDQILNLTELDSVDAGNKEIQREPSAILLSVLNTFEQACGKKGLKFSVDEPEQVKLIAVSDSLLENALSALLDNALNYTLEGQVDISVSMDERYLIIEICDTGLGIKPTQREKLFQPFTRLHFDRLPNVEGVGLSLFMIQKQLEQYRASIEYQSREPVEGSCFRLRLPLV